MTEKVDRETGEIVGLPVPRVELGTLRASEPAEVITAAERLATPLAKLIKDRGLASNIQGKQYVRCEGWTTLAAMLGVTPHEVSVTEQGDGIFTATVELRRLSDGAAVARASAECGAPDETDRNGKPLWAGRARYARRSMALTRATAKACRLAFSWVMVMAGYEATPREEIPDAAFEERPTTVPFGKDKGRPLTECTSKRLQDMHAWCENKPKFASLREMIDEILDERRLAEDEREPQPLSERPRALDVEDEGERAVREAGVK